MGCKSCKDKKIPKEEKGIETKNKTLQKTNDYVFRFFTFIMAMIILPLTYPIAVVALFKRMVLKKDINLMPMLLNIGKTLKGRKVKPQEVGEAFDIATANPEDYKLVGVDEITRN